MIVAARELGPAAFGVFAMMYMVLVLSESVHSSLITSPFSVISASKDNDTYRTYTTSVASVQSVLAIASAMVVVLAALIAIQLSPALVPVLLALAFISAMMPAQEFIRRVLYAESRIADALMQDIVTHGLRLVLLVALILAGGLSESWLFLIFGFACLVGSLVGVWQIRNSLTLAFDRGVIREHWDFGNWLGAGRLVSLVPDYVTAALLSATLSVSAFGAYRAATQLVHAANVPLRALDAILRPKMAREAQRGHRAVVRTMQPILVGGGAIFVLFAAFVIVFREPLMNLIYGAEYAQYSVVLVLIAARPLTQLVNDVLTNALLAFRQTRTIFIRSLVASSLSVLIGGAAIYWLGLPAAGAVKILGLILGSLWLLRAWKQYVNDVEYSSEVSKGEHTKLAR